MPDFHTEIIQILLKQKLSDKELDALKRDLSKKNKLAQVPTNIEIMLHCTPQQFSLLKSKLLSKPVRSQSGVAPLAIMTKPFPCPHGKCIMCPGGVNSSFGDVPQSYTGKEPATMRGIRNNYDPYLQVFNRLEQYVILGHNCEKVELIIMGGTFPSFPKEYQEEFIKYAFKAMNDFSAMFYQKNEFNYQKFKQLFELPSVDEERTKRVQQKLLLLKKNCTLEQEQDRNETAMIRCVALCIETRPDYGMLEHGNQMLRLGCTRVELGIQSVYDSVLKDIERGHTTKQTKQSLQILRDLGFKVAAHYMPGLPKTDIKKDLAGMKKLFSSSDYKPDMLKIYPCMVLKGTKLYQRYLDGKFKPLDIEQAAKLIAKFKSYVPEYCRIMRIQRDIPETQIETGAKMTNLRQYLNQNYKVKCRCIRCREPKSQNINWNKVNIKVQKYLAAKGTEYFISAEDPITDTLIGFVRMRYPSQVRREEITKNSALIRELHVYGQAAALGEAGEVQHRGWGRKLMDKAQHIAKKDKKTKMVVISGIGVREYYRKLGYRLEGVYMVKEIN